MWKPILGRALGLLLHSTHTCGQIPVQVNQVRIFSLPRKTYQVSKIIGHIWVNKAPAAVPAYFSVLILINVLMSLLMRIPLRAFILDAMAVCDAQRSLFEVPLGSRPMTTLALRVNDLFSTKTSLSRDSIPTSAWSLSSLLQYQTAGCSGAGV